MEMEDTEPSEEEHALFVSIPDLAEITDSEEDPEIDKSASIKNPNRDDPRRLFQVYNPEFQ